jgi:dolichol-phosphate mannosyltransferase
MPDVDVVGASCPPRAVILLPTFDERENIEPMVLALREVLDISRDRVLVIDDKSPDGTGEIADRIASEHPWVWVLHRERKEGLGPAFVAGIRQALETGAELVLEMDCDFSHDPGDVPRLIAAAEDADLVLGSRYVPGGGSESRSFVRRLISGGGCLYARVFLGVPVHDLTGGFKCFRRSALEAIDPQTLFAQGYVFHVETTYRVLRAGLRVKEVPIRFAERRSGVSKMSAWIVVEAIWKVPVLRVRVAWDARRRARAEETTHPRLPHA